MRDKSKYDDDVVPAQSPRENGKEIPWPITISSGHFKKCLTSKGKSNKTGNERGGIFGGTKSPEKSGGKERKLMPAKNGGPKGQNGQIHQKHSLGGIKFPVAKQKQKFILTKSCPFRGFQ